MIDDRLASSLLPGGGVGDIIPVRAGRLGRGSPTRLAENLFVHKNTVAERIKRAEEMLGRGVNESPLELEAALTLAAGLGHAVLGNADGVGATDRRRPPAAIQP